VLFRSYVALFPMKTKTAAAMINRQTRLPL